MNKDPWTPEEDAQIRMLHSKYGNRWAEIAKHMSGRYARDRQKPGPCSTCV